MLVSGVSLIDYVRQGAVNVPGGGVRLAVGEEHVGLPVAVGSSRTDRSGLAAGAN